MDNMHTYSITKNLNPFDTVLIKAKNPNQAKYLFYEYSGLREFITYQEFLKSNIKLSIHKIKDKKGERDV